MIDPCHTVQYVLGQFARTRNRVNRNGAHLLYLIIRIWAIELNQSPGRIQTSPPPNYTSVQLSIAVVLVQLLLDPQCVAVISMIIFKIVYIENLIFSTVGSVI